jgi:5-methylcytosine-specific restriction endonuclease McrA
MPSVSTKSSGSKNHAAQKNKKPIRHHVKASIEDINWVRSQLPCVQQLWLDCVSAEQFGKQMHKLETHLSDKSFRIAKAVLEKQGLFRFEQITELTSSGRAKVTGWKVENLHGYYYQREQERKQIREESYQEFLGGKYWKKVRRVVLKRDKCCQACGSLNKLHVHHLSYKHHGDEMNHLEDLVTLCAVCHQTEHSKSSND